MIYLRNSPDTPDNAARILESITDAFMAFDHDWRFTYVNDQSERVMARTREQLLGRSFWDEFPATVGSTFEREYRRAVDEQVTVTFEEFYPPLNLWVAVRAYPSAEGLSVFYQDVTEQAERRQRERFLAELAERARRLTDPDEVIADALRSVGEFLGVSRCVFVDIDIEADICTCHPDYRADDSVASIAGVFPISTFGSVVVAAYGAGRVVAVDDVHLDRVQVPAESIAAYDAAGIRAHASVPVVHSDRLVSCIGAHSSTPRHWKPEEIALLRSVVERTWLTVEVLRQERALVREAEATTRMLESITDAFFTLDRNWNVTRVNDRADQLMTKKRPEILGRNFWEVYPNLLGSTFEREYRRAMAEGVAVTFEEFYRPLDAWLEVRAYPSADGLSVFYQDISERKALEAERERLAERERNIARQLQAALTPAVPEHIPGMAIANHYEAALAEAGVGGDFYDVFPINKCCTALVVGDLSGKGLAAAAQVATVRNMLRYAILRGATIVEAVTELNALLVEQGFLTGFATLFVGTYDSRAGTLTYVNCGQEPALVRRRNAALAEWLPPTGPVLGSFMGENFEGKRVTLAPGDALAVFTDGLTEAGSSRREMLGIEGVADLLTGVVLPEPGDSAASVAERLARCLIAGVNAAAQEGVMRDDVCLLVGVVE